MKRRIITVFATVLLVILTCSVFVSADENGGRIKQIDGKYYIYDDNGSLVEDTGVVSFDGEYYLVREGGLLASGWYDNNGSKMYFPPKHTLQSKGLKLSEEENIISEPTVYFRHIPA